MRKNAQLLPSSFHIARATHEKDRVISVVSWPLVSMCYISLVFPSLSLFQAIEQTHTHTVLSYNTTSQPAGPAHTSLGIRPPTSFFFFCLALPAYVSPYHWLANPSYTQHNQQLTYCSWSLVYSNSSIVPIAYPQKAKSVLQERVTRAVCGRRLITRVLHKPIVIIRCWFVRLCSRVSAQSSLFAVFNTCIFLLEHETKAVPTVV